MKILLIEDNPEHAEIIKNIFIETAIIETQPRLSTSIQKIESEIFDIILCDLNLEDSTPGTTLSAIRPFYQKHPFIILTAGKDDDLGEKEVNFGAQDYLTKDYLNKPDLIKKTVQFAIKRFSIIQNERMIKDKLSIFTNMVCHDFSAPLKTIYSYTQLLDGDDDMTNEEIKEGIGHVQNLVSKAISTLKSLHDFSNATKNKELLEPTNINQILKDILIDFKIEIEKANAQFNISNLSPVVSSKNELGIILQNLISNSLKFKNCETDLMITISGKNIQSNKYRLTVKDNGTGIKKEHHKHIFDPFYKGTSKNNETGTGLGLATLKKLCDYLSIPVSFNSSPEDGTEFHLDFNLA